MSKAPPFCAAFDALLFTYRSKIVTHHKHLMNQVEPSASLAVTFSAFPSERMVGAISRLILEFCKGLVDDSDVADRFHMAAQELAENLVKYSSGPRVSLKAELRTLADGAVLEIQAKNQSSREQLFQVEKRLAELTTTDDPVKLYDRLILESAPSDEGSGLGLARIRAEGELDVDYSIDGDELTISVHSSVHPQRLG